MVFVLLIILELFIVDEDDFVFGFEGERDDVLVTRELLGLLELLLDPPGGGGGVATRVLFTLLVI